MEKGRLDDSYIRKHARPGEDWGQARWRVEGEVFGRHGELLCPDCAEFCSTVGEARDVHYLNPRCLPENAPFTDVVLNLGVFKEVVKQHENDKSVYRSVAVRRLKEYQEKVDGYGRHNLENIHHAVMCLMLVAEAKGYLKAVGWDLELLSQKEYEEYFQVFTRKGYEAEDHVPDVVFTPEPLFVKNLPSY